MIQNTNGVVQNQQKNKDNDEIHDVMLLVLVNGDDVLVTSFFSTKISF